MTIQCRKKNQHNQNMNYIWDNNENLKNIQFLNIYFYLKENIIKYYMINIQISTALFITMSKIVFWRNQSCKNEMVPFLFHLQHSLGICSFKVQHSFHSPCRAIRSFLLLLRKFYFLDRHYSRGNILAHDTGKLFIKINS